MHVIADRVIPQARQFRRRRHHRIVRREQRRSTLEDITKPRRNVLMAGTDCRRCPSCSLPVSASAFRPVGAHYVQYAKMLAPVVLADRTRFARIGCRTAVASPVRISGFSPPTVAIWIVCEPLLVNDCQWIACEPP